MNATLELPELLEYVDVFLWARPVLACGLTLSVQSWEGRTVAGSILFPGSSVPLSANEISVFTKGRDESMPHNPQAALHALIAVNEALVCLDYDATGAHPADSLIEEATESLLEARERLGACEWPERTLGTESARRAWLDAREREQKADGRL